MCKLSDGNDIIDLSDVTSEKQNTPGKATQGNGEYGDYLPTPPEDQEQNNQKDTMGGKEKGEDEMRSITSEQTAHTKDGTIRSRPEE